MNSALRHPLTNDSNFRQRSSHVYAIKCARRQNVEFLVSRWTGLMSSQVLNARFMALQSMPTMALTPMALGT